MFILAILFTIIAILIGIVFLAVALGGAVFILIFGDVIVCIVIIVCVIRHIMKKRKKRK